VLEIERKFLVKRLPPELEQYRRMEIAQGYLAHDPMGAEVRLRKTQDTQCLTVKRPCPGGRIEQNVPLTAESWEDLWPMTAGRRLFKARFCVPYGKYTIEIDIFQGANNGLIVAEVEFPDVESARTFQPPDWLGDEVTGDPRYSNRRRAVE